jgi:hypothetical protein
MKSVMGMYVPLIAASVASWPWTLAKLHNYRPCWGAMGYLNDNLATLGLVMVGVFVEVWLSCYGIYRVKRYDDLGASPTRPLPAQYQPRSGLS